MFDTTTMGTGNADVREKVVMETVVIHSVQ